MHWGDTILEVHTERERKRERILYKGNLHSMEIQADLNILSIFLNICNVI